MFAFGLSTKILRHEARGGRWAGSTASLRRRSQISSPERTPAHSTLASSHLINRGPGSAPARPGTADVNAFSGAVNEARGVTAGLIRMSVGVEHLADLVRDLRHALNA